MARLQQERPWELDLDLSILGELMELLNVILHINDYLPLWLETYGTALYFILFLIIFCETGLVVMPFLPGDSLLFALGALTVMTDKGLDIYVLSVLLVVAAFLGDNLNYTMGRIFGKKILDMPERPWLKKRNIHDTHAFLERHGRWAIVIARFVPIVRTFAPFVAGLGEMKRRAFLLYSVFGAILWTQIFLWAGHFFGQTPFVKKNFSSLILVIIVISILPLVVTFIKIRFAGEKQKAP